MLTIEDARSDDVLTMHWFMEEDVYNGRKIRDPAKKKNVFGQMTKTNA